jgi:uncharacterized protein (DUF362 family)
MYLILVNKYMFVCVRFTYVSLSPLGKPTYKAFHIARSKEEQHTFGKKRRFSLAYFIALSKMKICTHREKTWTTMKLKKRFGLTSNRYFVTLSGRNTCTHIERT